MTMQCSDLSHPQENLQWVKRLSDTEYLNDALIVAGPSMAIAYHVYTGGDCLIAVEGEQNHIG